MRNVRAVAQVRQENSEGRRRATKLNPGERREIAHQGGIVAQTALGGLRAVGQREGLHFPEAPTELGNPIAVVDVEHGNASKYADIQHV
jgi:hypothetical protein